MSVPAGRMAELREREDARFAESRPRSRALVEEGREVMPYGVPMSWMARLWDHPPIFAAAASGPRFTDVDGHEYLDFNIADASAFCGFTPEPVVRAIAAQAASGVQLLLPTEDSIWVACELCRRFGLPFWQFTLSATTANVEAIRLARHVTGRPKVLMFDGKYHGHAEDTLVVLEGGDVQPEYFGVDATARAALVQFNDLDAVRTALELGDIACVLTEPAMTNLNIVLPDPGFHEGLRRVTRETGTLLVIDETHTLVTGPGGLVDHWSLDPDIVTMGKSIAAGVPLGAYGMTAALADRFEAPPGHGATGEGEEELATGGTLFANALSMAAARAALGEVLTDDAYARTTELGGRLADGIQGAADDAGLPWRAHRLFAKSGYWFEPELPRNAIEVRAGDDLDLRALIRVYMANRGVWEGGWWLGPTVSVAMTADGIGRYVEVFSALLTELVA